MHGWHGNILVMARRRWRLKLRTEGVVGPRRMGAWRGHSTGPHRVPFRRSLSLHHYGNLKSPLIQIQSIFWNHAHQNDL